MRSAHNATNTVQPAHLASPTRTRAAKTSPSCHVVWAHSRKARTRRKAWAGSSGVHRPASRPPAPSRVSRCAAIIERNCPRVEGSQRKPHPVATAVGLSAWDHTTGGHSHADVVVLMSGPPTPVLQEDAHASRPRLKPRTRIRRCPVSSSLTTGAPRRPICLAHPQAGLAEPQPVISSTTPPEPPQAEHSATPLTIVVSDSSPMSLTLGIAPIDHIQDREKRKGLHDILCPNRG